MRKIFTLLSATFITSIAFCQFSFNIQAGGHLTVGTFGTKQVDPEIQGGISFNIPVFKKLFLQPGMQVMRHSWKGHRGGRTPMGTPPVAIEETVSYTFLMFPVRLMYDFRKKEKGWYAGGGADYYFLINEGRSTAVSFSIAGGYNFAKRWFAQCDLSPLFIYKDNEDDPYATDLTKLHQQILLSIGFKIGKLRKASYL